MSATVFVFIGYLLFVAFSPIPFDLGFLSTLLLIGLFVDLFWLAFEYVRRGNRVNS